MKTKLNLARFFAIVPLILMLSTGSLYAAKGAKAPDSDLQTEIDDRMAADAVLQMNLDDETANRVAADNTETTARETADTQLRSELASETTAREADDTQLQGQLNTETTAREAADTAESTARKSGDDELRELIDGLVSRIVALEAKHESAAVLARAYINVDGQPGYTPPADFSMVELYDTNGDGVPSIGDTIITGTNFPLGFNAMGSTDRLPFDLNVLENYIVNSIDYIEPTLFRANTANGFLMMSSESNSENLIFNESGGSLHIEDNVVLDFILYNFPTSGVFLFVDQVDGQDSAFLDVDIHY